MQFSSGGQVHEFGAERFQRFWNSSALRAHDQNCGLVENGFPAAAATDVGAEQLPPFAQSCAQITLHAGIDGVGREDLQHSGARLAHGGGKAGCGVLWANQNPVDAEVVGRSQDGTEVHRVSNAGQQDP